MIHPSSTLLSLSFVLFHIQKIPHPTPPLMKSGNSSKYSTNFLCTSRFEVARFVDMLVECFGGR